MIEDVSGRVRIRQPLFAKLEIDVDVQEKQGVFSSLSPDVQKAIERMGIATRGWFSGKNLRCRESYLEPGDILYVLGTAKWQTIRVQPEITIGPREQKKIPFIISDSSESSLVSTLTGRAYMYISISVVIVVVGLIFLLRALG